MSAALEILPFGRGACSPCMNPGLKARVREKRDWVLTPPLFPAGKCPGLMKAEVSLASMKQGGGVAEFRSDSLGIALRGLGRSIKTLVQSEGALARAEMRGAWARFSREVLWEGVFGVLVLLSGLSFLSFLIIGLGRLLGDNFWLSSLIVAIVLGFMGGGLAYGGLRRMKSHDLTLPRTRELFQKNRR